MMEISGGVWFDGVLVDEIGMHGGVFPTIEDNMGLIVNLCALSPGVYSSLG